jgi:hypothetical protein
LSNVTADGKLKLTIYNLRDRQSVVGIGSEGTRKRLTNYLRMETPMSESEDVRYAQPESRWLEALSESVLETGSEIPQEDMVVSISHKEVIIPTDLLTNLGTKDVKGSNTKESADIMQRLEASANSRRAITPKLTSEEVIYKLRQTSRN